MIETQNALDLGGSDIAAIEILAAVVNRHSIRAEAGDILISAWGDGKTTFSAADDDLTLTYRVERAPSEPYAIGLDATFLAAITEDELSASLGLRADSASCSIGDSRLVVPAHASNEYPSWDSAPLASVPYTSVPDAIARITAVAGSASTDEGRGAVLMGVLFDFDPDVERGVRIVATDGYQIAMDSLQATSASAAKFILPARTARFLEAIARHAESFPRYYTGAMEIRTSKRVVHFCYGPFELVVRYVDGTYPNYGEALAAAAPTAFLIVEREEFLAALQRAWIVASDRSCFAVLEVAAGRPEVALTIPDRNGRESYVRVLAVDSDLSEDVRVALNAKYAADVVSRMRGLEIAIGFVEHGKRLAPVTFRDVDDVERSHAFVPFAGAAQIALMPLRQ